VPELIDEGIGGVVSLDGPIRTADLKKAGIDHLPVYQPMLSLQTTEEQERFLRIMPQVIEFIDGVRSRGKATLVHCFYGCDRTGAAIACYLVAREGYTAEQGIAIVQRLNPDAMQMIGYKEVVHTFAATWNHVSQRD
jgi:protein-tyrosine phosphatase